MATILSILLTYILRLIDVRNLIPYILKAPHKDEPLVIGHHPLSLRHWLIPTFLFLLYAGRISFTFSLVYLYYTRGARFVNQKVSELHNQ